jgi:hypothetical protein
MEQVRLAFVHQALTIPGLMGSEVTLSREKVPALDKMEQDDFKLYLHFKNGTVATTPLTNVIVSILI